MTQLVRSKLNSYELEFLDEYTRQNDCLENDKYIQAHMGHAIKIVKIFFDAIDNNYFDNMRAEFIKQGNESAPFYFGISEKAKVWKKFIEENFKHIDGSWQ